LTRKVVRNLLLRCNDKGGARETRDKDGIAIYSHFTQEHAEFDKERVIIILGIIETRGII
jgi:hypothetical protein